MREDVSHVTVARAQSPAEIEKARQLFQEYADSLGFDLGFQSFDDELANLPGDYAPPDGCLLLAMDDDQVVGCVALRKLGKQCCEIKRLYVKPGGRGMGIGKALAQAIIAQAKKIGYTAMRLDTVPSMQSAQRLYESLGFVEIEPYRYNPIPGSRFMELDLEITHHEQDISIQGEDHSMSLITVIGRGHGGTRAMSHTLIGSGVMMGQPLNRSGDLIPPDDMYEACRVMARYVKWLGRLAWDWSQLPTMDIPQEFTDLIQSYLKSVFADRSEHKGWKIPETTLCFPWITRMFPEAKYIYWIRDPRDNIAGRHRTDDLREFGIEYEPTEDERLRRAISWIYQYKLVKAMPKPEHWIEVRFEDFIFKQEETLTRLEAFLGFPLARIIVRPEVVGRWKTDEGVTYFPFLGPAMDEYGYER